MKILTVDNSPFDLNTVPNEIGDIRYCVLDAADKDCIDFYFLPLIFLESFHAPSICLQIGKYNIQMPMDWSVLICDEEYTAFEVIPLASLNNRGFRVLCMNPLSNKTISNEEITISNIFQDVKWYFPKLKNGHMLAIPLEDNPNPKCAFFVKDVNKVSEIEMYDLLG
jgi:hypothetical protein